MAKPGAELWGRPRQILRSDRIWQLRGLRAAPRTDGGPLEATRADLPLLLDWFGWFDEDERLVRQQAEQRPDDPDGGAELWEVDGRPVSMCGYSSPTSRRDPHRPRVHAGAAPRPRRRRRRHRARLGTAARTPPLLLPLHERVERDGRADYARLGYVPIAESRQYALA